MEDLKYIRNMLNDEIEKMEEVERKKIQQKSENVKVLEKDVNTLIHYTVHDFCTGYGIKKQKDILKNILGIVVNQNEKIIDLENKMSELKEKI